MPFQEAETSTPGASGSGTRRIHSHPEGSGVPSTPKSRLRPNPSSPGLSPPVKRTRTTVSEAPKPRKRPNVPSLLFAAPLPELEQCGNCLQSWRWLRKHQAAKPDCKRWKALHLQDVARVTSTQVPPPLPYRPDRPPEDYEDLGDDMPIADQPPYGYQMAADIQAVKRLMDIGFFNADEVDVDLDTEPFEINDFLNPWDQDELGEDFDPNIPLSDSPNNPPLPLPPSIPPVPPPLPNPPISPRCAHVVDELHSEALFKLHYPVLERGGKPVLNPDGQPKTCHSAYDAFEKEFKNEGSYRPFENFMSWEIAQWAKLTGPTVTSIDHLLAIPGVRKVLHYHQPY